MEANNLYSLSPNGDVTVLNLRSKLIVLENTYINQEMVNSCVLLIMELVSGLFIAVWLVQ